MGRLLRFRRPEGGRRVRNGSDARPFDAFVSDASPASDLPRDRQPDPEAERRRRYKRSGILILLFLVFVAGSTAALIGDRGYLDVRRSRAELKDLEREVEAERANVLELKREADRIKSDPARIERIAREDLGLVQPGELTFLLPPEDGRTAGQGLTLPPPAAKKLVAAAPAPRD